MTMQLQQTMHAQELADRLGATKALSISVDRARARKLLEQLERRWLRRQDQAVMHQSGRVFVPDDARYSLFNNSVHEVARWLEALDANVSGVGVTANFKLREPQPTSLLPEGGRCSEGWGHD